VVGRRSLTLPDFWSNCGPLFSLKEYTGFKNTFLSKQLVWHGNGYDNFDIFGLGRYSLATDTAGTNQLWAIENDVIASRF